MGVHTETLGEAQEPKKGKSAESKQTISFMDILLILIRRKKLILIVTAVTAVGSIIYSIGSLLLPPENSYLPNKYTPEVIIMLKSPSGSSSGGGASSFSGISDLAALAGISINSEADQSSNLVMSLMQQNTFKDQLALELDFKKRYDMADNSETTFNNRERIASRLTSEYDSETGLLHVAYTDIDKEFATEVVNRAVEILQTRFKDVSLKYSREKLAIIDESIQKARINMQESQKTFTNFQKKYGFYDLESSTASSLSLLKNAGEELINLQSEYKKMSAFRSEGDPQLLRLSQQIEQQKDFITSLKRGSPELSVLNIAIDTMPDVIADFMILKQELAIQQGIYSSLRQQYESTQIEEISGSKIFSILEKAEVPLQKSGPSRGLICVIAAMAAFFLSVLAAFVLEYLRNVRKDREENGKLEEIVSLLKFKKRR